MSEEQFRQLSGVLHAPDKRAELERAFGNDFEAADLLDAIDPEERELIFVNVLSKIEESTKIGEPTPVRRLPLWRRSAAAAVIGLLVITGMLWWARSHKGETGGIANIYKNDIKPGGHHALLTLANGTTIVLDSVRNGSLALQGETRVIKLDSGILSYAKTRADQKGNTGTAATGVLYNTISTPAGGQYQVTLADGTRVWLDALSSLKYPAAFDGAERVIELTGQAYFDVSKDGNRPFRVKVGGLAVDVLGTTFNINAYPDEPSIKTTLLSGAVKLSGNHSSLLLKPGEQGQAGNGADLVLVRNADTDEALAWKNGLFYFQGAGIQTVMRQLARWYNVQVRYEGTPVSTLFDGEIGRDLTLTQVLKGMSKNDVHFRLEGNTLTVLP